MRVALHVNDPNLRARISGACKQAGVEMVDAADADIVLADAPLETTLPVIALTPASESGNGTGAFAGLAAQPANGLSRRTADHTFGWPGHVRAEVPAELDAATLFAVIAVVAAGFEVWPRRSDRGARPSAIDGRSRPRPGDWAESHEPDTAEAAAELNELPALTAREREVLALLAQGASNKAIARALSVSVHTAKFHVASVTEKLGASGRLEAVAIAIRCGLVMI